MKRQSAHSRKSHFETGLSIALAFCFFILAGSISFAKVAANKNFVITEAHLREVETLMQENNIKVSSIPEAEMEKVYRAGTAAHRTRLSQVYLEIAKDPQFLQQFPEFDDLVKDSKKTVNALLEHDAAKRDPKIKNSIKVLARLQGYDWRKAPDGVSEETHKKISKTLSEAIGDVNLADESAMEKKYKSLGKSSDWVGRHKQLTEVLDYYDTFKSRQSEMADKSKGGRTLEPPSQWIESLEKKGAFPESELNKNVLKKRFARYLEAKDPLASSDHFAKASDFMKGTAGDVATSIDNEYAKKSGNLLHAASKVQLEQTSLRLRARAARMSVKAVKSAKGTAATSAAVYGVQYLIDPENTDPGDILTGLTFTFDTAKCDTVLCSEFFRKCSAKLKIDPQTDATVVTMNSGFRQCLEDFFKLPLEEQTRFRGDAYLNEVFNQFSPRLLTLTCQPDHRIQVSTGKLGEEDKTQIEFSSNGSVSRLSRQESERNDFINYGQLPILQSCQSGKDCKNFALDKVMKQKLYIWTALDIPRDSFRWAQQSQKMIARHSEKLTECCGSEKCQKFFSERSEVARRRSADVAQGVK